ncbi:MAG: FtsK/SpoIIIE domain-containing protein, partial [Actinomycetota bacterium]|nr:FtsK/SpoIIIE domain-containing protein [Actinomycetota bacterium]
MTIDGRPAGSFGRDATIGSIGLRSGSVVGGRPRPGAVAADPPLGRLPGWYLVAVSGPAAGTLGHLPPGRHVIGRSADADFVIGDPLVSGLHAAIDIAGDPRGAMVTIEDLGSSNGTVVEGVPLTVGRRAVTSDSHLLVRATVLSVVDRDPDEVAQWAPRASGEPTVAFARSFRPAVDELPVRLRGPQPPMLAESVRAGWWRSLAPLVTGVGFALMTRRWEFLLLSAIAPLVYAIDAHRQRSLQARRTDAAGAAHSRAMQTFLRTVHAAHHQEQLQRRVAAPTGGMAVADCVLRSRRLWERRPTDPDFGAVTVGLADLRSGIVVDDVDPGEVSGLLSTVPVATSLLATGALLVHGPTERRRAATRALVIGLCASHSPSEVEICILTAPEGRTGWAFAAWLPHLGARFTFPIAGDRMQHDATLSELRRLFDTRRAESEQSAGDRPGKPAHVPLIVVVVDGVLPGNHELAVLLDEGRKHGVVGIIADETLTIDGVQSRLTVGQRPGFGSFTSSSHRRVDVLVAELTVRAARQASLHLAGLRPTAEQSSMPESGVQLLDVLGWDGRPAWFAERWVRMSPSTAATIGVSRGVPLTIDLANDGPHGLFGGMSGSGKTELLMTLLTSLCLNNHPDDLGIVIVDFKGGVDHDLTARLPHVIDLSTNLDVDRFQRTIDLLKAEQLRRQQLLRGRASDLDTYRRLRRADPGLPPLPRLLVVIDEFSELLASDNGRRRLQELVSVTRIGRALGIHLLLVTQNFEGQLPPQIEANAGLRLYLRVMKPSHSRVVLDTGIAATVPPHAVGRGYLRSNGGEVVEFQTARVVGTGSIRCRPSPIHLLADPPLCVRFAESPDQLSSHTEPPESGVRRTDDLARATVPLDATDMAEIGRTLTRLAETTGWKGSAIPWPGELPHQVLLGQLLAAGGSGIPFGLEDRPDEQRHAVARLAETDEQVLLIGPGYGRLTDVLAVIAASAAAGSRPGSLHLFGIDLEGSGLDRLRSLPQCGAVATRDDALAVRITQHLRDEAARRRSQVATSTAELLLLVAGADRLTRRGDDLRHPLLQPLANLLHEAHGVKIRIILTGSASLADSRLAAGVDRRFVFQSGDDGGCFPRVGHVDLPARPGPRPRSTSADPVRSFGRRSSTRIGGARRSQCSLGADRCRRPQCFSTAALSRRHLADADREGACSHSADRCLLRPTDGHRHRQRLDDLGRRRGGRTDLRDRRSAPKRQEHRVGLFGLVVHRPQPAGG